MKKIIICFLLCLLIVFPSCSKRNFYNNYNIEKSTHWDPKYIPVYLNAMSDPDPEMRVQAFKHLRIVGINNISILEKVKEQCNADPSADVRRYCVDCLRRINPNWHDTEVFLAEMKKSEKNLDNIAFIDRVLYHGSLSTMKNIYTIDENFNFSDSNRAIFKNLSISFEPKFIFFNGHKDVRIVQKDGILPVKVIIKNNSSADLLFFSNSLLIKDQTGKTMSEIDQGKVYQTQDYSMAKAFWLGFPVVSMIKSGKANNRIRTRLARLNNIGDGELRTIPAHTTIEGIVFYSVPRNVRSIWNWNIGFSFYNPKTNQNHKVSYQLGENVSIESSMLDGDISENNVNKFHTENIENKLEQLKTLKDKGLITEEDYINKKNDLLESF